MPVLPEGDLSVPVDALRTMLANSTTFQKIVQAASATDAKAKITAFGEDHDLARPFGVASVVDSTLKSIAFGTYRPEGMLALSLEFPWTWEGTVGAVTSESVFTVPALAGLPDNFFNGQILTFGDEVRAIEDFDGATGEVTLAEALSEPSDAGAAVSIEPETFSDGMIFLMNNAAKIRAEVAVLSGTLAGYLFIKTIRLLDAGRANWEQGKVTYTGANMEVQIGI